MNIYIFNKLFINNRPLDKVVLFIINVCKHVLTFRSWCIYYYVLEYVYYIFAGCDANVLYTTPKNIKTLETLRSNVCRYGPMVEVITSPPYMTTLLHLYDC